MLHEIKVDKLGPRGEAMAAAVQACVHCGFCLPNCPTYGVLGEEMDSPRGRILLMKNVLEGNLEPEEVQPHIDRCLGCLACETNCPSGVRYGELLSPYRARRRAAGAVGGHRWRRWLAALTLPFPGRLRWALRLGGYVKRWPWLVPSALKPMLELVPAKLPRPIPLPARSAAASAGRPKVGLLLGCAQQVLAPRIQAAAWRVLVRHGFEVYVPPQQGCCGALAWHIGDERSAAACARRNLQAFPAELEHVVTTAAGCGSGIHDYPLILAGAPDEARARELAAKTIDISVLLERYGIEPPPPLARPLRVAYHDACHLSHAQRVRSQPRNLLKKIPNLTLIELEDGELCCGSAGTYNLDQPAIAAELGRKKAARILSRQVEVVALGNIGCEVQIERYLREAGSSIPICHTIELLDAAYRQLDPSLGPSPVAS